MKIIETTPETWMLKYSENEYLRAAQGEFEEIDNFVFEAELYLENIDIDSVIFNLYDKDDKQWFSMNLKNFRYMITNCAQGGLNRWFGYWKFEKKGEYYSLVYLGDDYDQVG